MLVQMKQVVHEGLAESASGLVREAISRYLLHLENEQAFRDMEEAARDPLFLADLDETMRAFEQADAETARMIPE
ncbi:MAG: hypothetical protein HY319_30150 [Armatimonadetes bacterium]|nr:hypothetical protein [Armatimonadota bacterium]